MTDCYLCGHPILEGQREGVINETVGFGTEPVYHTKIETHTVHRNVQDCLPTLGLGDPQVFDTDVRNEERERAAKIVEEWHPSHFGFSPQDWEEFTERINTLAKRIREDE